MLEFEVIPAALLVLLSMASPFVIAFFNKVKWSSKTRELVAAGVAIVVAVAWLALTGSITDWTNIIVAAPAVYTLQSLIYRFVLKEWASKFEVATDKGAVIITPAENPKDVLVTSSETIKVSEKEHAPENIEVDAPVEVQRTEPEPKG